MYVERLSFISTMTLFSDLEKYRDKKQPLAEKIKKMQKIRVDLLTKMCVVCYSLNHKGD